MKKHIVIALLALCTFATKAQHNIIPAPVSFESTTGIFMLDNQTSIDLKTNNAELKKMVENFQLFLKNAGSNIAVKAVENPDRANKAIILDLLKTKDAILGIEGYTLEVKENSVEILANANAGIFNGLQTLRQMLPKDFESKDRQVGIGMLTGCKIKDYPRFAWRGLMLDDSRHFFGVEAVKQYIDKMAQYKFNVFHWHLTDDEGWRIEIKSLPKLTAIGAWRVERYGIFGETRPQPKAGEKATYGGFYTQEQIKDIVQYAADRNITIVPEIDVPGHSMAVLAAYPELSTLKKRTSVNPGAKFAEWYGDGKFKMLIENTLNPADEKVYEFVNKVVTEVAALFPGQYIHMGGDESYHGYWEKDAKVQNFMKKNKIKDTHELQSYFVKRVEKIVSSKGKKLIGWDEILDGGLAPGAAVMSWRGMKGGTEAAKMGVPVVMTPSTYAYVDYYQGDKSVENSLYGSFLSLEKTYEFEPVPEGVDSKYILGGQANLWTEIIPNLQFAFYMTYPRAFSIIETLWSPKESKNWTNFVNRAEAHFYRFDAANTNISKAVFEPIITVKKEGEKIMVELANNVPNTEIYYSIDNTYPVNFGKKYAGAFEVPNANLRLRTQTFRNGQALGRELIIPFAELEKRTK